MSQIAETRHEAIAARLSRGMTIELAPTAAEFGVSVDTIRRDLRGLEARGIARCVRGGALPVLRPGPPAQERRTGPAQTAIATAALPLIADGMVLMIDGGSTALALAQLLPALSGALVVTPAPAVALAAMARGIRTNLIGGEMSPQGAIAVGHGAVAAMSRVSADLALMGVCGLDPDFGLGADDLHEAEVKRAMIAAASGAVALAGAATLGRRARHQVAPCDALARIVTDAPPAATRIFAAQPAGIIHA